MSTPRQETVNAIQALAKAAVEEMGFEYDTSVGIHINWGESEDYMRGFNDGFDSADNPHECKLSPPAEQPWYDAYLRGFGEGFTQRVSGDNDE
jgi:hypothetical protein